MEPYQILEHTADLKIRAFGKSQAEAFSNILKGMFESTKPKIRSRKEGTVPERGMPPMGSEVRREIKTKSEDVQSLLIDFLSEALYLSDVNNEAYFEAKFEKLTDKELKGEIKGNKIEGMQLEIKAVTWHDLEVKKEDNAWQVTVLFDI